MQFIITQYETGILLKEAVPFSLIMKATTGDYLISKKHYTLNKKNVKKEEFPIGCMHLSNRGKEVDPNQIFSRRSVENE